MSLTTSNRKIDHKHNKLAHYTKHQIRAVSPIDFLFRNEKCFDCGNVTSSSYTTDYTNWVYCPHLNIYNILIEVPVTTARRQHDFGCSKKKAAIIRRWQYRFFRFYKEHEIAWPVEITLSVFKSWGVGKKSQFDAGPFWFWNDSSCIFSYLCNWRRYKSCEKNRKSITPKPWRINELLNCSNRVFSSWKR